MVEAIWVSAYSDAISALTAFFALGISVLCLWQKNNKRRGVIRPKSDLKKEKGGWIPMHRALYHVALKSEWSRDQICLTGLQLEDRLKKELFEAFARGEVEVRGRRRIAKNPNLLSTASTQIPEHFWESAFIQPFAEIVLSDADRNAACTLGNYPADSSHMYQGIIVNRSQMEKRWPSACDQGPTTSPYFEALKAYWRNAGNHVRLGEEYDHQRRISSSPRTDC